MQNQLIKIYTKERKRLLRTELRFNFLKQCKTLNVHPKYLTISNKFQTPRLRRIIRICQDKLLRSELRNTRRQLTIQYQKVYNAHMNITLKFHPLEADDIFRRAHHFCDTLAYNVCKRHNAKLQKLSSNKPIHGPNHNQLHNIDAETTKNYVNLSKYVPDQNEETILNMSPKYAFNNHHKPSNILIPLFEQAISQLPVSKQVDARVTIHKSLSFNNRNASNLSDKKQLRTISNLKNNPQINILASDKSNMLVILDKPTFTKKAYDCIESLQPVQVSKDPTSTILTKLSAIKRIKHLPPEIRKQCFPPLYPAIPKMFFQIKLHKKDHPLRPLVARYVAPTFNLERATTKFLKPFFDNHQYTAKSSYEVKSRLNNILLPPNHQFHTMDAIQLFPSIPTDRAKSLILEKLQENNIPAATISAISAILNLILTNNFFLFDHKIYRQTQGAPMGLSLSPLLAECIMQYIERQTFLTIDEPIFYQRYVDDIFLIIDLQKDNFQDIYDSFNQFFTSIKFTTVASNQNNIPFLDMNIHSSNNVIHIDIYRKDIYKSNIIPYNSNHPPAHKWAYFKTLTHRAIHLPTKPSYIQKELSYLKDIALHNNYPIHTLQHIIDKTQHPQANPKPKNKFITLPYFASIHHSLHRLLKDTPFKLTYTACTTISSLIRSDRQVTKPSGGVYAIPFSNSNLIYIGRTKRRLPIRLKEHQLNLRTHNQDTALTQFVHETNIFPLFDQAKIITSPSNNFLLNYAEAVEIYINKHIAINTSSAITINPLWTDLLRKNGQKLPQSNPNHDRHHSIADEDERSTT